MTGAHSGSGIPYYGQWESPDLVPRFLSGSMRAAEDPRWAASGARTPEEYEYWADKVCGLACLQMILAARSLPVPPMMRLVEQAVLCGAYVPDGDRVTGMIYQPFADWVGRDFGITAKVMPDLPLADLVGAASPQTPVIASVHCWIRYPDRVPPQRGGHLVLVTGTVDGIIRLHNPSGIPPASQRDALIAVPAFERFFAERGLLITG